MIDSINQTLEKKPGYENDLAQSFEKNEGNATSAGTLINPTPLNKLDNNLEIISTFANRSEDSIKTIPEELVETVINPNIPKPLSDDLTFERIGGYKIVSKLGEGGMGTVFKAIDPKLKRNVALKLIRIKEADAIKRFLREASIQAQIDHENVCKVYETGEHEGSPYIAMQYIEGISLHSAAKKMSLEQKLKVMIKVAEGVQAAHKKGLIHRDIKPDNIMIEKMEDAEFKPYVVDFGIAKEQDSSNMTLSGTIVGTPQYMSPEQARGDINNLDRRADIYSLGATLYWLITEKPLFEGKSVGEILIKVINEDVTTIRRIKPKTPVDLDTIVMKCLDKNPDRRYSTAKDLVKDLQAFLDGEPISARPISISYRVLRIAKKNKIATTAILLTVFTIIIASLFSLNTYLKSQKETMLAQTYIQEVERIDSIIRQTRLLPIHNTSREKKIVESRLVAMEKLIKESGESGFGPGNYALGRTKLELGKYKEALNHLQISWDSGYQKPEVAYWLGRSLGEAYRYELELIGKLSEKEDKERKQKEAEEKYREPALKYLTLGKGGLGEDIIYGEALIAFYEKRWDDALDKVKIVFDETPWRYEAKKLEGDIYMAIGSEKSKKTDYLGAIKEFERAAHPYKIAMEIGSSDEFVYKAEGKRWNNLYTAYDMGGNYQDKYLVNILSTCEKILIIDPENIDSYLIQSDGYARQAEYLLYKDVDPNVAFNKAIELSEKALKLNPNNEQAHFLLSSIYWKLGESEMFRGIDPRNSFKKAIISSQKVIKNNPTSANAYNNIAKCYWRFGDYEMSINLDPYSTYEKGIEACRKALEIHPNHATAKYYMGLLYQGIADCKVHRGDDPRDDYRKIVESYKNALELVPNDTTLHYNLAVIYYNFAVYEIERGNDPTDYLNLGISICEKSLELDPNFSLNVLASMNEGFASHLFSQGKDPTDYLEKSVMNYQKSIEIYPTYPSTYAYLSYTFQLWAKYEWAKGRNPLEYLQKSIEICNKGLKVNSKETLLYNELSKTFGLMAEYNLYTSKNPRIFLDQATSMVEKSLEISPKYTNYTLLAYIERLAAINSIHRKENPDIHLKNAELALEKALELNPNQGGIHYEKAVLFYWKAKWQKQQKISNVEAIKSSLNATLKALSYNPKDSKAYLIKNALKFLEASTEISFGKISIEDIQEIDKPIRASSFLKLEFEKLEITLPTKN